MHRWKSCQHANAERPTTAFRISSVQFHPPCTGCDGAGLDNAVILLPGMWRLVVKKCYNQAPMVFGNIKDIYIILISWWKSKYKVQSICLEKSLVFKALFWIQLGKSFSLTPYGMRYISMILLAMNIPHTSVGKDFYSDLIDTHMTNEFISLYSYNHIFLPVLKTEFLQFLVLWKCLFRALNMFEWKVNLTWWKKACGKKKSWCRICASLN